MQWALLLSVTFALSEWMAEASRRERQVTPGMKRTCPACAPCSEKSCSPCRPRLFLLIWRVGIQQHVACVHTCPSGYFSVRGRDVNRCTKCKAPSCDRCFSKDFCMTCKEGWYLHQGKCFDTCPTGTSAQLSTRECQECELSWSTWSPCSMNGERCGYKWGTATRIREDDRLPSGQEEDTRLGSCQPLPQEEKRCRLPRFCTGDRTERRRRGRKEKERVRVPQKGA
ncbi:R-spondin-4 [Ambystoma mexicanum]|uniref:R-spondin-4 n=1 Tax=Ambystoma mexicanum TaxID=8296 RepID=UPI0037E7A867